MKYFTVDNREFFSKGKFIKICKLVNEWYEDIENPEELIANLKKCPEKNHIFSFIQRVPHVKPKYDFYMEPYPVSIINIKNYKEWWEKSIGKKTRQAIKTSLKKGVQVKIANFNDKYIKGISEIYNETPIRAGKPFPHYKDSFEKVKKENGTFSHRCIYLGAYYANELIGFSRIIIEKEFADILQFLSKISHRDKNVNNALLDKIVEICCERNLSYIAYGDYDSSGIGDFKRRNGFIRMDLPRYFVPLNVTGAIALKLRLHQRISQWFPDRIMLLLRDFRKKWYEVVLR